MSFHGVGKIVLRIYWWDLLASTCLIGCVSGWGSGWVMFLASASSELCELIIPTVYLQNVHGGEITTPLNPKPKKLKNSDRGR